MVVQDSDVPLSAASSAPIRTGAAMCSVACIHIIIPTDDWPKVLTGCKLVELKGEARDE